MKTGRPGYYIPSPATVLHDVKKVFVRCQERIAKMLQVSPCSLLDIRSDHHIPLLRSMMELSVMKPMLGPHRTIRHTLLSQLPSCQTASSTRCCMILLRLKNCTRELTLLLHLPKYLTTLGYQIRSINYPMNCEASYSPSLRSSASHVIMHRIMM